MKNTQKFVWIGALVFCVAIVALWKNHRTLEDVTQNPTESNQGSGAPKQIVYESDETGNNKQSELEAEAKAKARFVKSFEDVVPWLKKNAEQNDRDAQFVLGQMYQEGRVFPQDLVEAFKWYSLAAQQGDKAAEKEKDNLKSKLTAEQVEDAAKRVSSFSPSTGTKI